MEYGERLIFKIFRGDYTDIKNFREITSLDSEALRQYTLLALMQICSAFWMYDYTKKRGPHAILKDGKHSDGYFNVSLFLEFPNIRRYVASMLASRLIDIIGAVDVVVSSSYAAINFGQAVSEILGKPFVFLEKVEEKSKFKEEKPKEKQQFTGRFEIPPGARVLLVEDLVTTLSTTIEVRNALREVFGDSIEFVTYKEKILVAALVHRPNKLPIQYADFEIISLIEEEVHSWLEENCEICKQTGGEKSEALKPKANWSKFQCSGHGCSE